MRKIAIKTLFIDQCSKCHNIIWHNDMKDTHIIDINFCPYCGHKLNKDGKLEDLTGDDKNEQEKIQRKIPNGL